MKTILKRVGFFSDLRHGDAAESKLHDSLNSCTFDRKKMRAYLDSGTKLIVSPGPVFDVIDPNVSKPIASGGVFTDGIWAWPTDLGYYVEKYGAALPDAFVLHCQDQGWRTPEITSLDSLGL
jgi:hypothetical protein